MRKFLILLGILFFLAFQGQAAETTWRHSGSEVTGYDYNFTNKYSINNVLWVNGTNLNVSDVRQDLNFNNKNITQIELVNGVNFTSAIISDYDYIIYQKPGSVYDCGSAIATCVISKNGSTQRIQNASSSFSTVLINTTSNIHGNSKIYIKSGTYIPTQEVNYTDGISIVADGATLDVSNYDGTVFNVTGVPNVRYSNNQTMLSGFRVKGDNRNNNTLLINVTCIPRGLIIRDIYHEYIDNVISITSCTFDADIYNVNGIFLEGTWINLSSTPVYQVTNAKIHDSEVSNTALNNSFNTSIGINIRNLGIRVDATTIDKVWIESFKNCIIDNGTYTKITNNLLSCRAGNINNGVAIEVNQNDNRGIISGNNILLAGANSIGVNYSVGKTIAGTNTGNFYSFVSNSYPNQFSTGIRGNETVVSISGNQFSGSSQGNQVDGINITNASFNTSITGNTFLNINRSVYGVFSGVGNIHTGVTYKPSYETINNSISLSNNSLLYVSNIEDNINTTVNNSGLVLKIISDENYTNYTNPVLYDTSGFGNNGYWSGHNVPNFTTWKAGTPLKTDGADDFLTMNGNDSSLIIKSAITISGWVKINNLAANGALFGRGEAMAGNGNFGYFVSYFASTNTVVFDTYDSTTRDALSAVGDLADNDWHHIVGTWDGSTGANGKKLYIDGTLRNEGTSTILEIGVPNRNFKIGEDGSGDHNANAEFFDIRVYNRYMDADEVNLLYHSNPQDEKTPVIRENITTFVNNSGYEKFSINQTGVFSNFTMPICSKSVVNQTGSMCLNMTSEPTPNFPQVNIWNGTRWTFMNGTGV